MPNLAVTLKQEIARLARNQARALTSSHQKANAQYRRDIAELKRRTDELQRKVGYLEAQEKKRVANAPAQVDTTNRRFSATRLAAHREKIGISAADYGALVGVTSQTIYNWEQERTRPQDGQLAKLVEVRSLGKREAVRRVELMAS